MLSVHEINRLSVCPHALAFEELIDQDGVEIHLVKEGRIIGKNSRSQDKFIHDIHVAVAKHYSENLKGEVKKGMSEKAEHGVYPAKAPFGYRNNRAARSIDVDEERAPILGRMFELYATAKYSLSTLRKPSSKNLVRINRAYLEKILKNRFYLGQFVWRGVIYDGNHQPLVSLDLFQRVQMFLQDGTNRSVGSTNLPSPAFYGASMMAVL